MNIGRPDKGSLGISCSSLFPKFFIFFFMSSNPHISRRRRGLSPEITSIVKIGRRKAIMSTQQGTLRRNLSDSDSSPFSPTPIIYNMASTGGFGRTGGGSGGTGGASSSQPSASSVIGSLYSHQVPVQSTTNPAKIIKKYGLFQLEEDATTTPSHVSSPLNLVPATRNLPKFKENLPSFFGNNTITTNEHLVALFNACHNIGANDNDTCMHLFSNSLEGKATTHFFDLPPKILSTWEELVYWFKSTYGNSKSPTKQLQECNNIA
jgi:hypothetical protein